MAIKKFIYEEIISIFKKNPKKKFNYKQISKILGFKNSSEKLIISSLLEEMLKNKKLSSTKSGSYVYRYKKSTCVGVVDVLLNGNAYVSVEGLEKDVFIRKKNLPNLVSGDEVLISSFFSHKKKRVEGEILEITKRSKNIFVGDVEISENAAFVLVLDNRLNFDIFLPNKERKKIKNNQRVVVEIIDWGNKKTNPTGKIKEILGFPGEYNVELKSVLSNYEIPLNFKKNIIDLSENISENISSSEIKKRRDFRKITTFTIDPDDAKDFDDALSIKQLKNGNYEIGIHIADVSFYVKENDPIDIEARKRATSVYLNNFVVPMIPEYLSNKLCSLRPKEEKLCFSAVFELNNNANIINEWFGKTIIFSDHRFTYKEAFNSIKNKKEIFHDEITTLNNLAKKLRKKRINNGSLAFERRESKIILNKENIPTNLIFKEVNDSHKLVEEFMLLANKKVSEFISSKKTPFIYRVHDSPDVEKLNDLNTIIKRFDYNIKTDNKKNIATSINKLFSKINNTSNYNMIELLVIKSMSKAAYDINNIGHYGLAFNYYSHFTSPIRRYPDIIVHRILNNILNKKNIVYNDLNSICKHSSNQEIKASKAEREFNNYLKVKYMSSFKGKSYKGIISHITDYGMFVEITENGCEGFIKLKELSDDHYYVNDSKLSLIGFNTGKQYNIGDNINITIKDVNIIKKQINIIINNN